MQLVGVDPAGALHAGAQRGHRVLFGGGEIHRDEEAEHGSTASQPIRDGPQRIDVGDVVGQERDRRNFDSRRLA